MQWLQTTESGVVYVIIIIIRQWHRDSSVYYAEAVLTSA
jgi:hypothetical protein